MKNRSCLGVARVFALLALVLSALPARADPLLVFAAASLKNVLDTADTAFTKETGVAVRAAYEASGTLAKQIEAGAPADVFISADLEWMDDAAKKGAVKPDSRRDWLGNALVLVGPASQPDTIDLGAKSGLAASFQALLGSGRLAIGDPHFVPAGKYAESALHSLGLWDLVKDHLAPGANVRAALALVSHREAPLGIVYSTDAKIDQGVRVVGTFPETSHKPIVYPIALTTAGKNPEAGRYLAWLTAPAHAAIFTAAGFSVVK